MQNLSSIFYWGIVIKTYVCYNKNTDNYKENKNEKHKYPYIANIIEKCKNLKGEMVLIIEGNANPETDELVELNDLSLIEHYNHYIEHHFHLFLK